MSIYRKLYFLGFGIYLFSFILPAIPVLNEPVKGYYCAYWVIGALFTYKGITDLIFTIFANLANICTILVFVLQFKQPFNKLIILQIAAFLSACYWIVFDLIQGNNLSNFLIGYWNWVFGILFMLITMTVSIKEQKRWVFSQPVNSRAQESPNRRDATER
jgi:hypothetical protein